MLGYSYGDEMEQSDREIVKQVLGGEVESYGVLVERYHRQIFNLMYRFSHKDQDAADLTQDAFLRAYERLESYRMEHSFFSWLYSLASNLATDWSRRWTVRSNKQHLLASEKRDGPVPVEQEKLFESREELDLLQKALCHLSDATREILLLRYKEELSIREVAQAFSLSESGAKMRISRGLKDLRKILENNDGRQ